MLIRKATIDDLREILGVYENARRFMRESGNEVQWGGTYPEEELLREDIAQGKLFVCDAGPQVFAFSDLTAPVNGMSGNDQDTEQMLIALNAFTEQCNAAMGLYAVFYFAIEDDPTYQEIDGAWAADGTYGVIHRIAVAKRGEGVATFCLDWAFRKVVQAEGAGGLRIDTHECNTPMRNLLTKSGFVECGTIICCDGTPRTAYQKVN